MIIGTNCFPSKRAANAYYKAYGYSPADVQDKVDRGEIKLTQPELKRGEKLIWLDDGMRYGIESKG